MRMIDAEPIIKNLSAMKTQLGYDAIDIDGMIKALREAEEVEVTQTPNDPLTMEELREMDGEPVWVVGVSSINNFNGNWDICSFEGGDLSMFPYCGETPDINLYGITWKAYRRKPEEGTA